MAGVGGLREEREGNPGAVKLIRIATGVWVNPEHIIAVYRDPLYSGKVRMLTTSGEYVSYAADLGDVIQKLGGDPK